MLELNGISFTGNACRVVTATWNGRTFTAGERVWAALFAFQAWLDRHHPGLYVYVIQGAYHAGYAPSAGTHDLDRALDTIILNRKTGRRVWIRGRRWWRAHGWACWWRHTGSWYSPSAWHFHQVQLGGTCPVGEFIPGQISDYYQRRTGLVGHVLEPGWYPPNIDSTIFDYPAWLTAQEDDMPLNKDDIAAIRAVVKAELVDAATTIKVGNPLDPKRPPWTLDTILRKLWVGTGKQ